MLGEVILSTEAFGPGATFHLAKEPDRWGRQGFGMKRLDMPLKLLEGSTAKAAQFLGR